MIIYVRYPNMKVDYVNSLMVGSLIRDRAIIEFFRPSEQQWVNVEHGRVRKDKSTGYIGVERRAVSLKEGARQSERLAGTLRVGTGASR